MPVKEKTIKLPNLIVNPENFRFEPLNSEKEAINQMLDDQGDKLYNLAEHIMNEGFDMSSKIQVINSNRSNREYIVLEGNRRLVALKLLNNPDLIEKTDQAFLKRKFRKLHDDNVAKLITEIECVVYDDPNEAYKWIKLKHGGQLEGVGTVPWNPQQLQRFEEKVEGKASIGLQALKLLEESDDVSAQLKKQLPSVKITSLYRLLGDADVKTMLGVQTTNGVLSSDIDKKEVVRGLSKIVTDILDKDFSVKNIYTKQDRLDYIDDFPSKFKPNLKNKVTPWHTSSNNSVAFNKGKIKAVPVNRNKLIPKTSVIRISKSPRINKIYDELKRINVNDYPNASGVLLRVFVELSVDFFLEHHKLIKTPSSAKSGASLFDKISTVANHLVTKGYADTAINKSIKMLAKDKNSILGVDTWHAYIHNHRVHPRASDLCDSWDGIQDFMSTLWANS